MNQKYSGSRLISDPYRQQQHERQGNLENRGYISHDNLHT